MALENAIGLVSKMTDRERVIKGLECCTFILGKRKCNECPYQKDLPDNGCYQLQDDFHALLKEREEKIHDLQSQIAMLIAAQHELCEIIREQKYAQIKEPDCRICAQTSCRYYHNTMKPKECKSFVKLD